MTSTELLERDLEADVAEDLDPDVAEEIAADEPTGPAKASLLQRFSVKISGRRPLTAGLCLVFAVLAGLAGYFGYQYYTAQQTNSAAEAALRTANSYAVTLTSVDTGSLDANFAAVLDGATGEFRDMYAKSSTELRKLLIEHKASGHGVVVDSAVKSASPDEVKILLFVDQTVSNTEVPDPRVDRSRIAMTMQKVDGVWKAAKVELP